MKSTLVHGLSFALAATAALTACGDGDPPRVTAVFDVPGTTPTTATPAEFYNLPFPSDIRLTADHHLDLTGWPARTPIVQTYVAAAEAQLDGFGTNSTIFTRLNGAIDVASLPDPATSQTAASSVYLVNVDPTSSEFGKLTPLRVNFTPGAYGTIGTNSLAAEPYPGFPLREGTTYALVITNRVHDESGRPLQRDDDFNTIASVAPPIYPLLASASNAFAPLWSWLDANGANADHRDDVIDATVFTTQHVTQIPPVLRKAIYALAAPSGTGLTLDPPSGTAQSVVYNGTYSAPNFESGAVPYSAPGSGQIILDDNGLPVPQLYENLRFCISIPKGTVPTTGWPIAIYQHGTGGDYHSFIEDGTAQRLAKVGIASISMDQVLHGTRNPGGNPEIDFFNFQNPDAARNNVMQGVADSFSILRLAIGLTVVDGTRTNTFDAHRIYYFGHSQGSSTGAPFVAYEPLLGGAVLSGAGGVLSLSILNKTEPIDIPSLVGALIHDDPVDEFNPTLALVQMWGERADSENYAPMYARRPATVDGVTYAPQNVYISEGFVDHYAPNPDIEAFATGAGAQLVNPVLQPIEGLTLLGGTVATAPVTGNLNGATVVIPQYTQAEGSDGHFVVFEVPAAMAQSANFLGTAAATGKATLITAP